MSDISGDTRATDPVNTVTADAGGQLPIPPQPPSPEAQQKELSQIELFDWFSGQLYRNVVQVAAVIAVAAAGILAAPAIGFTAAIATAGSVMLGFEIVRAHIQNTADLNRELVLYHDEIAGALGKSPKEHLTIKDMRNAADEKMVGDKVVKPLQMELEHLSYRGKYNMLNAAGRAAVTVVAAIAMQGQGGMGTAIDALRNGLHTAGPQVYYGITTVLGFATAATLAVEKLGKDYFDKHKPISVYNQLVDLEDQAKSQAIRPEQVFDIIIKIDKDLAKDIENHLGQPYNALTYRNKQRVIKATEDRTHAKSLAQGINDGVLPVTAIAMTAMKQMDWPQFSAVGNAEPEQRSAIVESIVARGPKRGAGSFVADLGRLPNTPAQIQLS